MIRRMRSKLFLNFILVKIILAVRSANFSHIVIRRKFVPAAINFTLASLTLGHGDDFDM